MNKDKIILNKKYKYKELCILFDEKPKTGNAKPSQIKYWQRHLKLIKVEKANYIITEIYDTIKPKEDGRVNNGKHPNSKSSNSLYAPYIDKILLDSLKDREITIYITLNDIASIVGIVNKNYRLSLSKASLFRRYLADVKGIDNNTAYRNIYYHIRDIMRSAINSSVNRLQREGYIRCKQGYILIEKDGKRLANAKEEDKIQSIEQEVLVELGIESKNKLGNKREEYYSILESRVIELYPNIIYFYKGYRIKQTDNIDRDSRIENTRQLKKELNIIVIDRILDRLDRDYAKAQAKVDRILEQIYEDEITEALDYWEYEIINKDYIMQAKVVMETIIDIDAEVLNIEDL